MRWNRLQGNAAKPPARRKLEPIFNLQFSIFNLQYPRERTRAQNAPSGLAAHGRNQIHLLQILVVTLLTVTSYGKGLEIFVKFLTMFEVSSTEPQSSTLYRTRQTLQSHRPAAEQATPWGAAEKGQEKTPGTCCSRDCRLRLRKAMRCARFAWPCEAASGYCPTPYDSGSPGVQVTR